MRGEHSGVGLVVGDTHGSSPHARGARGDNPLDHGRTGLIPACAGSTTRSPASTSRERAHPRMRGEHFHAGRGSVRVIGSSPHARGARQPCYQHPRYGGLIPACAGSTSTTTRAAPRKWAHPRMRGEHRDRRAPCRHYGGSSPHARGAPHVPDPRGKLTGLIPACAGSTSPPRPRCTNWTAHPRMRGEHTWITTGTCSPTGSSPHARGALDTVHAVLVQLGLIPACAGSTTRLVCSSSRPGAHPRMRGEHTHRERFIPDLWGSSPHARGARPGLRVHVLEGRLIPACAGSTRR